MSDITPVALFAHARPDLLARTLEGLRANAVPLIYAFSDGPRRETENAHVAAVRTVLRNIAWAEVVHVERTENLGLYRSILAGAKHVFERHETAIICEEDLLVAPGAYRYLTAALDHYRDDPRVFSVSAWTHARVTPAGVGDQPFFSHRVNTLFWGDMRRHGKEWITVPRPSDLHSMQREAVTPHHMAPTCHSMPRPKTR